MSNEQYPNLFLTIRCACVCTSLCVRVYVRALTMVYIKTNKVKRYLYAELTNISSKT